MRVSSEGCSPCACKRPASKRAATYRLRTKRLLLDMVRVGAGANRAIRDRSRASILAASQAAPSAPDCGTSAGCARAGRAVRVGVVPRALRSLFSTAVKAETNSVFAKACRTFRRARAQSQLRKAGVWARLRRRASRQAGGGGSNHPPRHTHRRHMPWMLAIAAS